MSSDASTDVAGFLLEFPEFGEDVGTPPARDWPDAEIGRWLGLAADIFDAGVEETRFLAAHLMVCWREDGGGASTGAAQASAGTTPDEGRAIIEKETIGPRSYTYYHGVGQGNQSGSTKTDTAADAFFARSIYGRMFLRLRDTNPAFRLAVGMG